MRCLKCGEKIVRKRSFKTLFSDPVEVLCQSCKNFNISGSYLEVIPINDGVCYHYFIKLNEKIDLDVDPFFLNLIYPKALKRRLPIIYFDEFSDVIIEFMDLLDWGDLILITIN